MSKIPTAKEFLLENADRFQSTTPSAWMIEFAKLHVEAALTAAGCKVIGKAAGSIKDMYPLENIK